MNSYNRCKPFSFYKEISLHRLVSTLLLTFLVLFPSTVSAQLSWKVFGRLKTPRWRFETQVLPGGKIMVLGGRVENNATTNTCEIIDIEGEAVLEVSPMNFARTDFATVITSNSKIYAFGGGDKEDEVTASVECYSIKHNKWLVIGKLLQPRRQHNAILINEKEVLIVGGRDSSLKTLSSVEIFNLETGKSKFTSSFHVPVNCGMTQHTSQGEIVSFGGRSAGHTSDQSLKVMKFCPLSEKWTCIDSIPAGSAYPATTKLWNGSVIYSGGKDEKVGNDWLKDIVLEYSNKFHLVGKMQNGRHTHWIAQLDENRVIMGSGLMPRSGKSSTTTDIIDIKTKKVSKGPEMIFPRRESRAVSVPIIKNGRVIKPRVIVISGVDDKFLNSIEILDDSPTISGIINSYSSVTGVGKFPTSQIQVSDGKEFAVGDKVLIAQMQERPFSKTLSNKSLRSDFAGNHEFGRIVSINGNTIALEKQLTHHYSTLGKVQLVRVPEYEDVAVTGELTCKPWDGETGGILAFEANGTVSLQSHINVSGKGFNGAVPARETTSSLLYEDNTISTFSNTSSGEGISSFDKKTNSHTLVNNGGESGTVHNTGGAGGANTVCGGDGSLGWVSELSLNQVLASKGGKPLEYNGKKVFMGGGGGAGHSDDGEIGTGGNGGGIVFISCDNLISNDYTINANGINGKECSLDGAGGGGAAGTIYLDINNLHYPMVVNAIGGNGGNSVITNPDLPPAGSGGGGAGGVLLLKKHHSAIVAHLDGGQQGIAASVFSEHKAQSGCEGMLLDNVQIVDASSDKPDHKSFIDDCLTEDCSEYKTSTIQIPGFNNQQIAETDEASIDIHAAAGYVYPNPATDRVTIYGTELDVISLYDNMGNRFFLPFIKNENSTTIDVSTLNNGIYFVKSRNATLSFVITK